MVSNSKNTELIVAVAMELFKTTGYKSVMVKDICRKAGVSHSSFYTVFSGKDDILVHILKGYKDDYEGTMVRLLNAESELEKLWVLYAKYISMAEDFGCALTAAMFALELEGKLSLLDSVNAYVERYNSWFIKFVRACQGNGIMQNDGQAEELVPIGVKLSLFTVYEWSASGGAYSLRDRAFQEMERFYNIVPAFRGLRP